MTKNQKRTVTQSNTWYCYCKNKTLKNLNIPMYFLKKIC